MDSNAVDINPFIAVGEELKAARLAQGFSLSEISERLRISVKYLEHLETGDRDKLPGATYVLGFVRSYAKLLSLESDALCQTLIAGMSSTDLQPEYVFVEAKTSEGNEWRNIIMIGVLLIVISYTGWYFMRGDYIPDVGLSGDQELAEDTISTPVLNQTASNASLEPVSDVDANVDSNLDSGIAPEIVETEISDAGFADNQSIDAEQTADRDIAPGSESAETPNASLAASLASPSASSIKAYASQDKSQDSVLEASPTLPEGLAIIALADAWVEVSSPLGDKVVAKLMITGETIALPTDQNYALTTGNAGAISLGFVDQDEPWVALGDAGQVLEKKPIDTLLRNNN